MIGLVAIVVPSFSIARLCVAWSWLAIVNVYWPALRLLLSRAIRKFFSVTVTATGCAPSPGEEEAALPEVSSAAVVVVAPPALLSPELSEQAVSAPSASASARTAPRRRAGGDEPVRTDTVPPWQPAAGAPTAPDPLPRCSNFARPGSSPPRLWCRCECLSTSCQA